MSTEYVNMQEVGFDLFRNPALEALDHLLSRLDAMICWYSDNVPQIAPEIRRKRVSWIRKWLDNEGAKLVRELLTKTFVADPRTQKAMTESILATESLLDRALARDLTKAQNIEMVWQWVQDAIPSLVWAFERYPGITWEDTNKKKLDFEDSYDHNFGEDARQIELAAA